MAGGCTCPIYYQRLVSVDKGSVIIRYKHKLAYQKKSLRKGNPVLPQPCFKHDYGGESNPDLPRTCCKHDRRIYYHGVVRVEKGCVIIRYKLAELIKKKLARNSSPPQPCFEHNYGGGSKPALSQPCFKHDYGEESNPALPQPCFSHGRRVCLSNILSKSCQC